MQGRRSGAARRYPSNTGSSFSPRDFGGLQLWLDSSMGVTLNGGTVSAWADQSGNGRNFSQGTAANQPTFNASDANFGGRPSFTFDGSTDYLSNAGFAFGTVSTVYAVSYGGTTGRILVTDTGTGSLIIEKTGASTAAITYFRAASTRKNINTSAVVADRIACTFATSNGATAIPATYLNGSETGAAYASTLASNGPVGSGTVAIGSATSGAANFFNGKIASILVYNVEHTASQVAAVDTYLKQRFGL